MKITQTKLDKWSKLADEADTIAEYFKEKSCATNDRNGAVYFFSVESAWDKVADAIRRALIKTPLPSRMR